MLQIWGGNGIRAVSKCLPVSATFKGRNEYRPLQDSEDTDRQVYLYTTDTQGALCTTFFKTEYIQRRWLSSGLLRRVIWRRFTDVSEMLASSIIKAIGDGGSNHSWNASKLLPDYTAQKLTRQPSSYSPPWEHQITEYVQISLNTLKNRNIETSVTTEDFVLDGMLITIVYYDR
jgi:hypothetical protein